MKGIVLGERYKEKDAYDIYYLISNYKNGPKDVANEINKHTSDSLVKESLGTITRNFKNREKRQVPNLSFQRSNRRFSRGLFFKVQ